MTTDIDLDDFDSMMASERAMIWNALRALEYDIQVLWEYADIDPTRRQTLPGLEYA